MLHAYSAVAVRAAEQPLLDAGRGPELMLRAAHGLAGAVIGLLRARKGGVYGSRVVLLIGSGNNGGDALYAGARLSLRGARTTALLTGGRTHPDALAAFAAAGGRVLRAPGASERFLAEAAEADILVDGLLGTGGRGGVREPALSLVARLCEIQAAGDGPTVVACDLPSGVDATTGEVHGPVLRAGMTVTFGAIKSGLLCPPGEQFCGTLTAVDIGLGPMPGTPELIRMEAADLGALLPQPADAGQKYTRGVLGLVAGTGQYPGAAQLAVAGALACGVGMVRYLGPAAVAGLIHQRSPEAVCSQDTVAHSRVQAWAVGSGIAAGTGSGHAGTSGQGSTAGQDDPDGQLSRCRDALATGLPVVADAGALSVLPENAGPQVMLTPHAGELAALLRRLGQPTERKDVEARALEHARLVSAATGATVLLKGPTTLVATPSGTVFSQANGTPWMATAGSGDTLAGILGALASALAEREGHFARHGIAEADRWAATAALAAALHGMAGAHAARGGPLAAWRIAEAVPEQWRALCDGET